MMVDQCKDKVLGIRLYKDKAGKQKFFLDDFLDKFILTEFLAELLTDECDLTPEGKKFLEDRYGFDELGRMMVGKAHLVGEWDTPEGIAKLLKGKKPMEISEFIQEARDVYWKKNPVYIGFFKKFKGSDKLLFSGNQNGIKVLRDIFQECAKKGPANIKLHEFPLFISNVELTLRSTKAATGMKKVNDQKFEWNLDPERMTTFAEVLEGLGAKPAHEYLDCGSMDDVQVMVSSGEYPDDLFKSGGTVQG